MEKTFSLSVNEISIASVITIIKKLQFTMCFWFPSILEMVGNTPHL